MKKCWTLAIVGSLLFTTSAMLLSQSPTPPPPDHWWNKSPFAAPDSLNRLLFHAEGNLSVNNMTGNYEMHQIQTGTEIDLRKGFMTGSLAGSYFDNSTTGDQQKMTHFQFRADVRYDFLPYLLAETGVLWEKYELHMLKDQYLPFLGIGTSWTISPMHQLNLFVAGGRVFPTYTAPVEYFGMKEGPYYGMYISQYYHFTYSQDLSFEETFVHLRNLDETKRYTTTISLNLYFALSQHLNIMVGYSRSLSTEAGFAGHSEVDAGQSVGINLLF
ncbi:MAG: hypothetical protein NTX44_04670 [Ignavibacteriales bacterium]|nr:hypothetical protein [Ignavibacteriales bacterium]